MLRLLPILAASVSASAPTGSAPPGPASMTLEVVSVSENGPWKLIATNTGEEPLRFAADARLLSLEVTPPPPATTTKRSRAPKKVTCTLPSALRPDSVAPDRAVYLQPGARWEEVFDPALYCFGKDGEVLVSGATVVAKLGFPSSSRVKKPSAPFVAEPVRLEASVTALKEIASEPFVLAAGDPPPSSAPSEPTDPASGKDPKAPRLSVTTPAHLDASNAGNVVLTATVRNVGMRSMLVHLRRDQLFFDVEGPTGLFRCGPEEAVRTVPRDFFSTMAPNATRSFSVRLVEVCPRDTFARPGLYRVRAGIAVQDGGADPRWGAYEGLSVAKEPTLVRVRDGEGPFYLTAPYVVEAESTEAESASQTDAPAD